jgi:hypothetical protein
MPDAVRTASEIDDYYVGPSAVSGCGSEAITRTCGAFEPKIFSS